MPDTHGQTIHVLDPATVNQIAAGEVVERPASVVKELVENAIDAGARTIRIDLTSVQGGISGIRVTDDGCGMSAADAELAFAPHATSKIAALDDLFRIRTLGFRGEALASIAAVAKVTLITKPRESAAVAGTRLVVTGGVLKERQETGAPEGTSVVVEELFFNTPARKKFQKNLNTELARIHGILEGLCLAHPQVSFRFYHNNREQLVTDRTAQPLDTIARIFGNECARELIPVSADLPFMRISGFVSRPSLSRRDHDRILVSINDRYVSTPSVTAAVKDGYGTLLSRTGSRSHFSFLRLTPGSWMSTSTRAKKEVRLSKEKEIGEAVRDAVHAALSKFDLIPEVVVPHPQNRELAGAENTVALTPPGVAEPALPYGSGAAGLPATAVPASGNRFLPCLSNRPTPAPCRPITGSARPNLQAAFPRSLRSCPRWR